jgi:hypothetical protein
MAALHLQPLILYEPGSSFHSYPNDMFWGLR